MEESNIVLYEDTNGKVNIDVILKSETIWLTQKNMAELFDVNVPAINKHLYNIYEDGELIKDSTVSKMEIVQKEVIDKSKVWQFNLKIGWCILVLAILNNYLHFLGVIFTPNAEEFVQGVLYGVGIAYELICVYNVTHELTLKEKKQQLFKKLKK